MQNKKMFKILNLLLLILFHIIINVIAKKKSQIIILGGGGGGHHMPYMHSYSHAQPSFIPFPIPIPIPSIQQSYIPHQQPYMPPIFIQQQPMSIPSPSHHHHHHHQNNQPTTQHIYHHHQNNQPQVHFVQLPIYKRDKYQAEYKAINTPGNYGNYQASSEQYPVYSDYSYEYTQPSVHRRNGLEFDSIKSRQQFINQNDSNCRREQLIEKIRREKYLRQKKRESKKKKYSSTIDKNEKLINKYEYHLLNDNKTELNLDKN